MKICQGNKRLRFCFLICKMWLSGPTLRVVGDLERKRTVSASLLVLSVAPVEGRPAHRPVFCSVVDNQTSLGDGWARAGEMQNRHLRGNNS